MNYRLIVGCLALLLVGCGGNGVSSKVGSDRSVDGRHIQVALSGPEPGMEHNVHVIEANSSIDVVARGDSLVLSGNGVNSVKPGDVIMSRKGPGFLKDVETVKVLPDGKTIQLQTKDAPLFHLYKRSKLSEHVLLDPSRAKFTPAVDGVRLLAPSSIGSSGDVGSGSGTWSTLAANDITLVSSGNSKVTLSGQLGVQLDAYVYWDYDWYKGIHAAGFSPKVSVNGSLTLGGNYKISFDKKAKLGTLYQEFVFPNGVPGQLSVDIYVGANGQVEESATFEASAGCWAQGSVDYSQGAWHTSSDFGSNLDFVPKAHIAAQAHVYAQTNVSVLVFNAFGPEVDLYAPDFGFSANLSSDTKLHVHADVSAHLDLALAFRLWNIVEIKSTFKDVYSMTWNLFDKDFDFGSGGGGSNYAISQLYDVNVADGTVFEPNQSFTKIWGGVNSGNVNLSGSRLEFDRGDQLSAPASVTLGDVPPGTGFTVSVPMVSGSTDRTYTGYWRFVSPGGAAYNSAQPWVTIVVRTPPPPPPSGYHYDVWRGGNDARNRNVAWAAQSFTAQFSTLSWVTFNSGGASATGCADSATVYVYTDEAMTNQIGETLVNDINDWGETTATFASPIPLNVGQKYWVQVHSHVDKTPLSIFYSSYDDYGSGFLYLHDWGGSTIYATGRDLNMRMHS